jgi:Putative threonine efflux protein
MIEILYKGIIIGILVSAPMGPVGLLCIQRTLNKGPWHGFFSGVGAAFSDVFYAGITCIGLGIVIDFIVKNQNILQTIGGILLLIYGIYTFQSNPSRNLQRPKEFSITSYSQDTVSAFFLTLSNPFIIFLYIALFARFNFFSADEKLFSILSGLLSILLGALGWWAIITFLVGKLRKIINVRGLWILNKMVGFVIILLSIVGIIYSLRDI